MSILDLPHEVVCHILQYLPLSDRTAVARTCRFLFNSCCFWSDGGRRTVAVTMLDDLNRGFDVLRHSQRPVQGVVFRSASVQKEHVRSWDPFWDNLGAGVTQLAFYGCDVSERTFCDVLVRCPNLRSLTCDDCNSLFMSGKLLDACHHNGGGSLLRFLDELNLPNNRYLSDALFNRLTSLTPEVSKLSLSGCQISFHPAIYRRFYPATTTTTASGSVLTFQNVLRFIERQRCKLRSLDLSYTLVDDGALQHLCNLGGGTGLRLRELFLYNCQQVGRRGIESVCLHQQEGLVVLDLGKCARLVDDSVVSVVTRSLTKLRRLRLASCRGLTGDGLDGLAALSKLQHLDLSACESLHPSGIQRSLCSASAPRLVSLDLSACHLTEECVVELARHQVHLRHLDLSKCRKGVTDVALAAICRHLRWLRTLKLAWCSLLTDAGLRLPDQSSGDNDDQEVSASAGLSNIRGLAELDLCGCSEITDVGVKEAVRFKELATLNLSLCHRISDQGLVSVGACNGSLEKLFLAQCREITDVGLVALVKCLPRLKHLDVQGCRKIGRLSMDALRHWCPELHYLDVSACPAVDVLETLETKLSRVFVNNRHSMANVDAETFVLQHLS